ncbi:DUF3189 family protein [Evansella sp. AB-P1]|uniref:DUF3189 family protein n=1 Tax=Evansella sp. AB-P1 TaxID=3037653 RepID=UPI00241D62F2|nr:DUF3189 family protein [Evansella sp. AB-P1]MDG5787107.1 DUF3189 family protein [Evansella sp. AB-P1]
MIYIYNCYGGTHSSALASAYHLNKLPKDRKPTKEEILNIDIFNKLTTKDMGRIIYHGEDDYGDKVYTMGRSSSKVVIPAMTNLIETMTKFDKMGERIIFSNSSPTVPIAMTFGGLFSRRLHIDFIGVPLLIKGSQQTYKNIIRLVERTISFANESNSHVEVLNNKEFEVNKLF